MSWIARFRIKNALTIANLISNAIGVTVVNLLALMSKTAIPEQLSQGLERTTLWFTPAAFLYPLALSLIYERPIRRHFEEIFDGKVSDPSSVMEARRRLLNEPFLLILLDFGMWIAAAMIYSAVAVGAGAGSELVKSILSRSLLTGLITVTVAFFGLVEELPKGNQQKVQFIAAVLAEPRLVILDEPFSGMDPVNQNLFKDLILEIRRAGTTVIFSTHQMETAERLCDRMAMIDRGRLVEGMAGPLEEVKRGFGKNSILLEFEGDGAFLATLPEVARVDAYGRVSEIRLHAGADPQAVLHAVASRLVVLNFEIMMPTLHNIFMGDSQVSYGLVIEVMDTLKAGGIETVGIITERPSSPRR